jgi:cellulose biosynthesis protein BcsQ
VDVWALANMAELIEEAKEAREIENRLPLRILVAVNLADPGDNRDTEETIQALQQFPAFAVPFVVIRRRKALANAMAHGLAIAELIPRDLKAVQEIEQLVNNLFGSKESAYGNHSAKAARQG